MNPADKDISEHTRRIIGLADHAGALSGPIVGPCSQDDRTYKSRRFHCQGRTINSVQDTLGRVAVEETWNSAPRYGSHNNEIHA